MFLDVLASLGAVGMASERTRRMARSEATKEKEETGKRQRPREGGNGLDMPGGRHGGEYTQGSAKGKL